MKKNTLVTSQRDMMLLMILAVAILVFVAYYFIISPALDKGEVLSLEAQTVNTQFEDAKALVKNYPTLRLEESQKKTLLTEKYKQFFYDLNQERILYKLDTLMAGAGFAVTSYTSTPTIAAQILFPAPVYYNISYPLLDLASRANPSLIPLEASSASQITQTTAQSSPGNNPDGSPAAPVDAIGTTDISLGFAAATYESTMAFLKAVENMDKSVIVKSVTFIKAEVGIEGQIILSLYTLPKVDDTDKDLLKFSPVIPRGKANPFN